jgi:hypothetical protein
MMTAHVEVRNRSSSFLVYERGTHVHVAQTPASFTTYMVVLLDVSVEPANPAGLNPLDHPSVSEELQVAVNRPEAHPVQTTTDEVVKLGCGRVGCDLPKFFEDQPSLSRHSQWSFTIHYCLHIVIRLVSNNSRFSLSCQAKKTATRTSRGSPPLIEKQLLLQHHEEHLETFRRRDGMRYVGGH